MLEFFVDADDATVFTALAVFTFAVFGTVAEFSAFGFTLFE